MKQAQASLHTPSHHTSVSHRFHPVFRVRYNESRNGKLSSSAEGAAGFRGSHACGPGSGGLAGSSGAAPGLRSVAADARSRKIQPAIRGLRKAPLALGLGVRERRENAGVVVEVRPLVRALPQAPASA